MGSALLNPSYGLGTVARAKGMTEVANDTGLSRESLHRSLSEQGRPELATAMKVLDSFDMRLIVRPKGKR
jgi:probable addiction module antidote protein